MPELPEVETVRRGLGKLIIKRALSKFEILNDKSFIGNLSDIKAFALGAKVVAVRRRAKVLIIDLSSRYSFVIHLKMTGQLVFIGGLRPKLGKDRFGGGHPNDSLVANLPDKSTRIIFEFSDGSNLYFNDQRKFGWVWLLPTLEVENIDFMRKVGPEPLEDDFSPKAFAERFRHRPKTNIKAALLDQTIIAGVGNIYADESLWMASIHPQTLTGSLSRRQLNDLYNAVREVMKLSIEKGGSTDRNYVDAEGKKGSYLSSAKVFRREGQACERCSTIIIKTRVAGRGTHICPQCQIL